MKTFAKLIAAILAVGVVLIALEIIASESGEVIVLTTQDANGATAETRLWVVEHEGDMWLRAGSPNSGWYKRLLTSAEIGIQRGAESLDASAEPNVAARDVVNRLMNDKYGWADSYIGLLFGRDDAIPIRLLRLSD